MARSVQAGDFNKGYQYEQAKRQVRKETKTTRGQRQNKKSTWKEVE